MVVVVGVGGEALATGWSQLGGGEMSNGRAGQGAKVRVRGGTGEEGFGGGGGSWCLAEERRGERAMTKSAKTGAPCRRRAEGGGRWTRSGPSGVRGRETWAPLVASELNGPKAG